MRDAKATTKRTGIDHKMATVVTNLKWEGRSLNLFSFRDGWRIRSRSKSFPVDLTFPSCSLQEAKKMAREKLAGRPVIPKEVFRGTLADVVRIYLEIPKRAKAEVAEGNVSRLKGILREVYGEGAKLEDVTPSQLFDLWPAYVAKRQKLPRPDYSARLDINHAIISAIRQAASIFMPPLRPHYSRAGINIPESSTHILWPALGQRRPSGVKSEDLQTAWEALRETDVDMWLAVGLARFAGLRRSEILACRGKWIRRNGPAVFVDLQDREADGYFHKTGKQYSAMVLHPALSDYLLSVPSDSPVIVRTDAERWIERDPQNWLRPFVGNVAKRPLHRLRGMYADQVKQETEEAILARAAAIRAASSALGHTSTALTEKHYLTPDGK